MWPVAGEHSGIFSSSRYFSLEVMETKTDPKGVWREFECSLCFFAVLFVKRTGSLMKIPVPFIYFF